MTGVTLSSAEFAYLLATVEAETIVGLEGPELFPKTDKAKDKTYKQGWETLLANEWAEPISGQENQYDLDSYLLEMVAIIAAPEVVIASVSQIKDEGGLLLNYISGDQIVLLAPRSDDQYTLGFAADLDEAAERSVDVLDVGDSAVEGELSISMDLFESMQKAGKSFSKKLKDSLSEANLEDGLIESLETAFTSGSQGEIVVAGLVGTEVQQGQRAWIYGTGDETWLFQLEPADGQEVTGQGCDRAEVAAWISDSLADMRTTE